MSEIDDLVTKLKQKKEENPLTLDLLKSLIENRKIEQTKSYFNNDEQIKQIVYLFYYYDKKGYRESSDQEVIYHDQDYLVVRAWRGYSQYHGAPYRGVWIIGIDNGTPWIHRVEWRSSFEKEKMEVTREDVRRWMGFTDDYKDSVKFEINNVIRLQGDLAVQKIDTVERIRDRYYPHSEIDKFRYEFEKNAIEEYAEELEKLRAKVQEDRDVFWKLRHKKNKTQEEIDVIEKLKTKYQLRDKGSFYEQLDREKLWQKRIVINMAKQKYHYDSMLEKLVTPAKEKHAQEYINSMKKRSRQVNMREGNHLIIIENAVGEGLTRVHVMEKTLAHVIHDEHQNITIELDAGVYRFSLLRRHSTDRR